MNKTYIPALITSIILAAVHFVASENHWYVRYYGTDVFMHVLGGAALAFAIYWILVTFIPRFVPSFWMLVVLTFFAGIAWEALETLYNIAGAPVGTPRYYVDTVKDLCNDTIGALITAYFIKK